MTTRNLFAVALLSFGFVIGCEVPELEGLDAPSAMPAPQAATEKTDGEAETKKDGWEQTELVDMEPAVTSEPREVTANDPTKGKKSRQAGGYLGAVGHSRFYAEHKMIFLSINHALDLFWATEGNYPKTHDEFMQKIVKFNQLQLPELDEGVEYIYDPEDHKLKIYRPGADATDAPSAAGKYIGDVAMGKFFAANKLDFDAFAIAKSLQSFKDEHDRYPETSEEFMDKVINADEIELPKLNQGMEYVYDPSDQTLKIYSTEK